MLKSKDVKITYTSILEAARAQIRRNTFCWVCAHERRVEIEQVIQNKDIPLEALARALSCPPSRLRRHRDNHMAVARTELR